MDWFSHNWYDIGTGIVTVASVLANIIPKHTIGGKIVQFLAFNLRGLFGQRE